MTARGTLAALLVPFALLVAACGDDSGGAVADPTGTETSSSATSSPSDPSSDGPSESMSATPVMHKPQCSDVWVEGEKLPWGYDDCYEGERRVKANGRYCEIGKPLITYREHWYATPGGPVNRTKGQLADDPGYQQAVMACSG